MKGNEVWVIRALIYGTAIKRAATHLEEPDWGKRFVAQDWNQHFARPVVSGKIRRANQTTSTFSRQNSNRYSSQYLFCILERTFVQTVAQGPCGKIKALCEHHTHDQLWTRRAQFPNASQHQIHKLASFFQRFSSQTRDIIQVRTKSWCGWLLWLSKKPSCCARKKLMDCVELKHKATLLWSRHKKDVFKEQFLEGLMETW